MLAGEMFIVFQETPKNKNTNKGLGRDTARGRHCDSYQKAKLETIAEKLGVDHDDIHDDEDRLVNKEQLCQAIKNELIRTKRYM